MSQKRQQQEDGKPRPDGYPPEDKRQRKGSSFRRVVHEVISLCRMQRYMEPVLEPLIRRVVKEEVESALRKYVITMKRSSGKEIYRCESRSLRLQFMSTISLPVFTGSHIEGEECTSLKVALVDALTREPASIGPESSAKVEIVVLEGDFDGDEGDNWTPEEFKNNIVKEREGKKPLLMGDAFLNLKDGIGTVADIAFTDNSSWTRSRKFRLGARVVENFEGIRVKEAKSESFIVRDHRGELYKKHHPPSLTDEVWRLEKIGKDGAFHRRLSKERVNTVKDFLTLFFLDPARLRNILGTGMSAKMWEVTVDHARTCVLDKKLYMYYPSTQQKSGVIFNIVGQVMGLSSDGQYIPVDKLSEIEKDDARNAVISAFRQWEEVICFDDDSSLVEGSSCMSIVNYSSKSTIGGTPDCSEVLTCQNSAKCDYPHLSASSPDIMPSIYSIGSLNSLDDFGLHGIDSMDVRFDQTLSFPGQDSCSLICDTDRISQVFCDDEQLHYFDTDCSLHNPSLDSPADLQSAVSGFLSSSASGPAQRRWKMLFYVLRLFSMKRILTKRMPVNRKMSCSYY